MKVVVLSRTPSWYPWRNDRCLRHLADDGHDVLAVIVERAPSWDFIRELMGKFGPRVFLTKTFAKLGRLIGTGSKGRAAAGGDSAPRTGPRPRIVKVASHNGDDCVAALRSLDPDLIVLRGCGIIKKQVLDVPSVGTLNAHYGLLPDWRGMDATEWAIFHGAPAAVTIHFVDAGVDTGAVLDSETIDLEPGDTLGTLADKSAAVAARLLASTATGLERDAISPRVQSAAVGRQFFAMHPRVRDLAERVLARRVGLTAAAGGAAEGSR